MGHSDISADLRNFFDAEFSNEQAMRSEARTKGYDDMDPDEEGYVPEPSLETALDSWRQAPEDVQEDFLRLPLDLSSAERYARVVQAEADLTHLTESLGAHTLLVDLI
jgi:hypothetical protein